MFVCVCARARARAYVRACVRAYVCVCVCSRVCARACMWRDREYKKGNNAKSFANLCSVLLLFWQ